MDFTSIGYIVLFVVCVFSLGGLGIWAVNVVTDWYRVKHPTVPSVEYSLEHIAGLNFAQQDDGWFYFFHELNPQELSMIQLLLSNQYMETVLDNYAGRTMYRWTDKWVNEEFGDNRLLQVKHSGDTTSWRWNEKQ